jgi:hypothetical protein
MQMLSERGAEIPRRKVGTTPGQLNADSRGRIVYVPDTWRKRVGDPKILSNQDVMKQARYASFIRPNGNRAPTQFRSVKDKELMVEFSVVGFDFRGAKAGRIGLCDNRVAAAERDGKIGNLKSTFDQCCPVERDRAVDNLACKISDGRAIQRPRRYLAEERQGYGSTRTGQPDSLSTSWIGSAVIRSAMSLKTSMSGGADPFRTSDMQPIGRVGAVTDSLLRIRPWRSRSVMKAAVATAIASSIEARPAQIALEE